MTSGRSRVSSHSSYRAAPTNWRAEVSNREREFDHQISSFGDGVGALGSLCGADVGLYTGQLCAKLLAAFKQGSKSCWYWAHLCKSTS